jgi:hypothetical protein
MYQSTSFFHLVLMPKQNTAATQELIRQPVMRDIGQTRRHKKTYPAPISCDWTLESPATRLGAGRLTDPVLGIGDGVIGAMIAMACHDVCQYDTVRNNFPYDTYRTGIM